MGQTVSLAPLAAGATGINVRELADLSYEKSLGAARFMKSLRARHKHGVVVVRVAARPFPEFDFSSYTRKIRQERNVLRDVPNALSFVRIVDTEHAGFLCRQYIFSSLYDRMSTRPFLEDIEKKWLAFQLLCAIRDCHSRGVYHGDLKTENVLVTSWNWLYITDFSSSFKKTYLPEDNPADFSYFFDASGRRTCYLAPERFLGPGQPADAQGITWAMDVFSAGCVIAELFLESPIFNLESLFRYRKGEYNPSETILKRIEDSEVRELVAHMIQVEPESRYSAEEYLNFWRRRAFPEYFYSFLHQYMWMVTDPSSGRTPVHPETSNFGEADERIDRVYLDFDKISYFLDYDDAAHKTRPLQTPKEHISTNVIPVQLDIPNNRHTTACRKSKKGSDDGSLIFLTLVVSSVRNSARATARVRACDLMLAFAERLSDDAKLDRILPVLVSMLNDPCDNVKTAAVRSIIQLLDLIETVSPINAYVFTEYIRPRLQGMVYDSTNRVAAPVRATYAACLASLAHASARILEIAQALRSDGALPQLGLDAEAAGVSPVAHRALYDGARSDLIDHFVSHTKSLLTDPDASVRRAFLGSVSSLCVFFGPARAADVIVSHLNTYLNDRDWMLRCAFFRTIVGIGAFLGSTSFEDFILPLMLQALTDPEDFVVEKVLSSFANMAELGLFHRAKTFEMVDIVARFMVHPNFWIRQAAIHFIAAAVRFLSIADIHCLIVPLLQPYLKSTMSEYTESTILDALKRPVSRPVLEMAANWSQKVEKGIFWKPQRDQRTFSFRGPDQTIPAISSRDLSSKTFQKVPKNHEDEQWLGRMMNMGFNTNDDGFKLLALREYITRMSKRRAERRAAASISTLPDGLVRLEDLKIAPQTVFFELHDKAAAAQEAKSSSFGPEGHRQRGHTITDALLDASQSINDREAGNIKPSSMNGSSNPQESLAGASRSFIPESHSSGYSPISSAPATAVGTHDAASVERPRLGASNQDGRRHSTTTLSETAKPLSVVARVKSLKHRSSAISLLGKRDNSTGSYGIAQTSTTATQASGEMDGPFTQDTTDDLHSMNQAHEEDMKGNTPKGTVSHTYKGGDPAVTRLLDSLVAHSAPVDDADFGPFVHQKNMKQEAHQRSTSNEPMYRPRGIHVATFGEHTGPINCLLASPDHVFFLSASDDGTVKVWDRHRFERSLIHRARQTHRHSEGARVTCIAFVYNTHTFVSCGSDGSVHVVKVECSWIGDSPRYGKLRIKRDYQLPEGEMAVWCAHFKNETSSVLILLVNSGRILALDLRTMKGIFTITIPPQYGTPTTACLGSSQSWILVGTTNGILALYDLRFRLGIRAWVSSGSSPINRIALYERPHYHDTTSNKGDVVTLHDEHWDRMVLVAGGTATNDISVWDVQRLICVEVFRVGLGGSAGGNPNGLATSKEAHQSYHPTLIDSTSPEELLKQLMRSTMTESAQNQCPRALCVGSFGSTRAQHSDARAAPASFVLTAGPDRKVRFWSTSAVGASLVVSGLAPDEAQPNHISVPSALIPGLVMNVELPNVKSDKATVEDRRRIGRTIAMQKEQQALLRGHIDVINDVLILEGREGRYIISADRKGMISVFM